MNKFQNASGLKYLNALFYEKSPDKETVLYTLKDNDYEGFPSLYKLYIEEEDILEYSFANKYFSGWEHWIQLCNCSWFKPIIERWRKEIELKIRTQALIRLRKEAESDSRNAFSANRYLLEKGWEDKKSPRGRPSKEQIKTEARRQADEIFQVSSDFNRIKDLGLEV